jgi:hypothetical protein
MMWSSLTSKELHKSTDDFRSYMRR